MTHKTNEKGATSPKGTPGTTNEPEHTTAWAHCARARKNLSAEQRGTFGMSVGELIEAAQAGIGGGR